MLRPLFLVGLVLMVTVACRISIPDTQSVVLTETRTLWINEPPPGDFSETMLVEITMGAGNLVVNGGSSQLLQGTIEYNVADWEPRVERKEDSLEIQQGVDRSIDLTALDRVVNRWALQFGYVPVNLRINAGAYEGDLDFSGVPLRDLYISDGAGSAELLFTTPNPVEMERLRYRTGASDVTMEGLGNANFERMDFDGGAGSYTLDFSGALRRDARVTINGGLGDFRIIVPSSTNARIEFNGELMDVNTKGSWRLEDNVYLTGGSGPQLDISINVGLGSITLESE